MPRTTFFSKRLSNVTVEDRERVNQALETPYLSSLLMQGPQAPHLLAEELSVRSAMLGCLQRKPAYPEVTGKFLLMINTSRYKVGIQSPLASTHSTGCLPNRHHQPPACGRLVANRASVESSLF